jgi:sialate O-acetylesterase
VHPKEKAPVGERLARLALNQTYGMSHVAQHGPTPVSAKAIDGKIILEFSNAKELKTSDGTALSGLEAGVAAGPLSNIASENIKIEGNRIIIEGHATAQRIRYAWQPFTDANLVNETGLPASTFEIEVF